MKIIEIAFIGTPVTDIKRARAFYEGVLGLKPTMESAGGMWVEYDIGNGTFGIWARYSEAIGQSRSEKLEPYLKVLYMLLEDLVLLQVERTHIMNFDVLPELQTLANVISFEWIRKAVSRVDDLAVMLRRNIQKSLALDSFVMEMRTG